MDSKPLDISYRLDVKESVIDLGLWGFRVFPIYEPTPDGCSCGRPVCTKAGKHPRITTGFKAATADVEQISEWWTRWPQANVGIVTGTGLTVVDIDGPEGEAAAAHLDLPTTVEVRAPDIGGQTLVAGVYRTGSVMSLGLTGNLTLDAQGDPRAVFIFQVESTLDSATDSSVSLINGAQACNVYWQVGDSATLGTRTAFKGTILALTSVSVNEGVTVDGRLLARNGAVTLINDRISRSQCAPGTGPGTSTGGGTPQGTPQFGLVMPGGPDTASGPDRKGPVVTITGVPARTARNFTVGVRVRDRAGIKTESVSVYLDGRRVKRTSRTRFNVKINVRGLRVGRHRLTVVARDRAGNRQTVTRRHFTVRAPKSPVPHFTG